MQMNWHCDASIRSCVPQWFQEVMPSFLKDLKYTTSYSYERERTE